MSHMRGMWARPGALKALVLAGIVAAGCVGCASQGDTPTTGSATLALIRERCTVCHTVQRIKAASHDADGWNTTVTRMREKGARVSDAQMKAIIEFLSGGGASGL